MSKKQYLYCIVETPKIDIIPCKGIFNCKPYMVRYHDIGAVTSEISATCVEINAETVLSHEEVVEYMMMDHTVLPVRFGTLLNSVDDIKAALKANEKAIDNNFNKVRGQVELGLKVILRNIPEDLPHTIEDDVYEDNLTPGRHYLLKKLKQEENTRKRLEDASPTIDEIYHTLNKYSLQSTIRKLSTERMLLNSSYLVPKENIDAFKTTVEILRKRYPSLILLFSGPWPAYNFVNLDEGSD
ncbi:MAG: GvpL/GvpF family gas vesicle protein [Bacillota bacterium]